MQLYLRDALPADVNDLVDLLKGGRLGGEVDEHADVWCYVDAIREIDASDHAWLLVADLGGRVVGMVQLFTLRHIQHRGGRCAEIESLRVADDLQDRGIANRLLDHAVRRARELGCYRIQVTSNEARHEAHRFYEDHGFVATHRGFKLPLE